VTQGRARAETEDEIAYIKWRRNQVSLERAAREKETGERFIPEREEGYPDESFHTREDAKKLRRREYSDMKDRHRT
jgi:hypothetical protein